ncbi:MAG: septum formation protein Maf [Zetaproteobacteria bacterium CG_4_9_14_3_um_filter_49_83]|nr:MAG: septum formation protein Maf [Zetaproteobacteria bacterium CG1_02_49_23]PIQ30251.1 MAG: septum formation protein Maf [Zetaproteobacteria bacterium CG17_big_fil_post_rev_8_21_14_2_50_50_13]PIV30361.1 MAG: septum formation protein Maf [Zetaproteobacteria bacterium CG02_land_8_20_14_3_00_50_9]PIY56321.1 MAG: septum formation protein Maf [Zetaproteobacteria bacterium CG_4_10_14_0_8_um_filter_49_80]PJA35258.1 MAG: septum formation protein Maf [Zetaproteobacteria bacterium CG_4_9_14_3_um_filt
MQVILASQSPRRLFLLRSAGIDPQVMPAHIDETVLAEESAREAASRLCREKSLACPVMHRPVITADTLVTLDDHAFGQPESREHAAHMIQQLSGRTHQVFTAVCVRLGEIILSDLVTTSVSFRKIHRSEIEIYLNCNDIMDKAGAYAVQSGASSFIQRIDGPLDNVIGLPVQHTLSMLNTLINTPGDTRHES